MVSATPKTTSMVSRRITWRMDLKKNWLIYLIMLPMLIYLILFNYLPMFGIVMAFQDFNVAKGYFASPWVGFGNFMELFTSEELPAWFFTPVRASASLGPSTPAKRHS